MVTMAVEYVPESVRTMKTTSACALESKSQSNIQSTVQSMSPVHESSPESRVDLPYVPCAALCERILEKGTQNTKFSPFFKQTIEGGKNGLET